MKKVVSFLFASLLFVAASCSYKTCATYTKAPVDKQQKEVKKDVNS